MNYSKMSDRHPSPMMVIEMIGFKSSGPPLLARRFGFRPRLWGKLEFTSDVQQEGPIEFYVGGDESTMTKKLGLLHGRPLAVYRGDGC